MSPTLPEDLRRIEAALRGVEMARGLPEGAHVDGANRRLPIGPEERFQQYLEQARSVRATEARGPTGLYHLFGNVHEMTSSKATVKASAGRRLVTLDDGRISMGGAWDSRVRDDGREAHWLSPLSATRTGTTLGFRCVRSAEPP